MKHITQGREVITQVTRSDEARKDFLFDKSGFDIQKFRNSMRATGLSNSPSRESESLC